MKNDKYIIQSVIFNKIAFTKRKASKWLRENGFPNTKDVDEMTDTLRYRQYDPIYVRLKGFHKLRIIHLNENISYIIGYKD